MIRSIEGLRGIAALGVALYHVYVYGRWGGLPAQSGVLRHAWLFVDLFFVVSGVVMAAAYRDRITGGAAFLGYLVRRAFRLYPLHLVTTVAVIATAFAVQSAKWLLARHGVVMGGEPPFAVAIFDPAFFGLELLLLQGVGLMRMEIHNYPAWSISVEFWMYVLVGLFWWSVRDAWLRRLAGVVILSACILHFLSIWADAPAALVTLDARGLPRGLLSFFIGVIVHDLWLATAPSLRRLAARGPWLGALQLVGGAGALALVAQQPLLGSAQLVIPFAFGLVVLLLLPDRGLVARALQTAPMQWLGVHSYSIYLTHITVQTVLDWPGRIVPEPWKHGVGLLFVATVLGLSTLTHRWIELPWRERGKRIAERIERRGSGQGSSAGAGELRPV